MSSVGCAFLVGWDVCWFEEGDMKCLGDAVGEWEPVSDGVYLPSNQKRPDVAGT